MLGIFLVLLGGIFWAISGALAQYLFKNNLNAEQISFYRLFFTGILLIIFSFNTQKIKLFTSKKEIVSLIIFGFFGLLLTQYSYFKAIFYTDAGTATMIQYCAPVIIMIFVCFKEKVFPKMLEILALILILIALFLLATGGKIDSLNLNFWGIFWGILGAFGVVFYSLCARAIILKYGLFFVMGYASLFGSFVLLVFLGGELSSYKFELDSFLAILGIIFIGTIGAFYFYLEGLKHIGALRASMIACIEPVMAALISYLFLGTFYSYLDLFAFSLIILSVILNAQIQGK